ncbi:MAG: O-antigen ligase family protein [Bacteroidota bacterium]|nr:O-antigen ligase family protein [Bacteroidota bacterium]
MKLAARIYFAFLPFILYIPNWTVIDLNGSHWLNISILNAAFIGYILFYYRSKSGKHLKNPILLSFAALFVISSISALYALNSAESIVKLTDMFTILSTLYVCFYFITYKAVSLKYLLSIIGITLTIDLAGSYYQYFEVISFTEFNFEHSNSLRGFYGNKNMSAIALMMKVPLVLMLGEISKSKLLKYYVYLISIAAFHLILLQSSRAAFSGIAICLILIILLLLIKKYLFNNKSIHDLRNLQKYILPILIAFILFKLTVNQNDTVSLENRVSSIINNKEDESTANRLRFFKQTLAYASTNPFLGCGIGNWKIMSIKMDSDNMFSYVVPGFAHNDILEILAETGIFGFLAYLSFFFFIFKTNLRNILMWMKSKTDYIPILLMFSFVFAFLDTNLNFPLNRADNQIVFFIYLSILQLTSNTINDEKN